MPTQAQYDYLSKLLGLNLGQAPAATPAGGSATAVMEAPADAPGGAPGGPADGATDGPPLAATDTEMFFAKDSAKLTDSSDTKSLDAYAAAMAATSDAITATGYASVDGDASHNSKLATERANAVKTYLAGKGIDAGRITAEGHGMTGQFGEKDLPSNRRVVLAPKPQAKAAPAPPPADAYDGPPDAPTTPPPPIPRLTPQQLEDILGPDKGVPRATVLKALTDFLEQLMQQQGGRSLKLTDTTRFAAAALGKGLPNEMGIEAKGMGTTNRVPKELAQEIANLLPDYIPHENFDNFLKMKPKDIKPPEKFSIAGALAKVVTPAVKKLIGGLPEGLQKKVLDSIEDAIVKGVSTLAETALDEAGIGGSEKDAILKAIEAAIQEKGGGTPPGGSAEAAAPGGAGAPEEEEEVPGGAPGGPVGGATDGPPLAATDTEIFFAKDSAKLTDSDTKSLDAYAAAMAATTDAITATGYASVDGDATHNSKLATERANAVRKYLADKGIDAGRITAEGHGMTGQFGEKDLPSNRRVVLAPKPPAKAPPTDAPVQDEYDPLPSPDAPTPPATLPGIPRLTPQQIQDIIGEDKGEPRATIEKELADFLKQLMTSQGMKSGVRITDRVRLAGNALGKGTKNENAIYAKLQDDRFGRDPAELAKEIAALLPDPVPRPNVDAFRAMKPKDIAEPEKFSIAGAIAKVLTPPIKKAISWLPEDIQKKITDSIEDGIVKGITKATEALLDQNNVDGATKEAILKAMEAAIKEKGDGGKK